MKICIDATPIGMSTPDRGGVNRYVRSLLAALSRAPTQHAYIVYFNLARAFHLSAMRAVWSELALPANFNPKVSRVPYRLRECLRLPVELTAGAFDVFHGCFDQLPIARGKRVVTLHDVRYLEDLPEPDEPAWIDILRAVDPSGALEADYRNRGALFAKLRASLHETLRRADVVITVSNYSKSRLVELTRADPARIKVVYHGVDPQLNAAPPKGRHAILERHGLQPGSYVLFVSKYDPLKNQLLLARAFAELKQDFSIRLVFVGPFNWYYHIVRTEVHALGIEDRVVFAGFASESELAEWYRGAAVFAFPSAYEGFGLPVLEAMAAGVPVLANAVCSIPEIAGDAVLYAPPQSAAWASKIAMLLTDSGLRSDLRERGLRRAGRFCWDETAQHTLAAYES